MTKILFVIPALPDRPMDIPSLLVASALDNIWAGEMTALLASEWCEL